MMNRYLVNRYLALIVCLGFGSAVLFAVNNKEQARLENCGVVMQEILDVPADFVTRIVGAELVRVRSQTTYYVLQRIKGICKVWLDRQRMAVA